MRGDRLRGIVVRSALSDHHDRFVEGFISANYGDTPVVGVLFAGGGGLAAGVIDTPARFRGSLPSLMQRLRALLPSDSAAAEAMRRNRCIECRTTAVPSRCLRAGN